MKSIFGGARKPRLPGRFFDRLLLRCFVVFSGFLKRRSLEGWKKAVSEVSRGLPQALASIEIVEPEPFKKMHPESLAGKGSSVDILSQSHDAASLPKWAEEIQPFLANQLSDHTRRAYETDLKQFFLFLRTRLDPRDFTQLKAEHIIWFRKSLEEGRLTGKVMSKTTINRKLAVVKSYLTWLRLNQVLKENPAALVKGYPQTQESALKGLSDEEARKLLDKPNPNSRSGALHLAILTSLLYLGLRKGELIGLKIGDLDEERGTPVIKVRGKGHRVRILPLAPLVKAAIDHYLHACRRDRTEKEAPLFTPSKNPRTGTLVKPLNPNAITYLVSRYAKKAGILKQISPHSCRATCISNALDRKATHRSVQHLAGWSTPLMIQRYDKRREDLQNSAAFLIDYGKAEAEATAPSSA